jgi:hypothetical protein
MPPPQLPRATIVLPVDDIAQAAAWCERALGFERTYLHGGHRGGRGEELRDPSALSDGAVWGTGRPPSRPVPCLRAVPPSYDPLQDPVNPAAHGRG